MNKRDKKTISKLADIIEANPGCEIMIDNDGWYINQKSSGEDDDPESIADSGDFYCETDFYSAGHLYGAAITEALIELLRRRGIDIKASAV